MEAILEELPGEIQILVNVVGGFEFEPADAAAPGLDRASEDVNRMRQFHKYGTD